MKRTALIVCPGRGTYNKEELGYLSRHHTDKKDFIAAVDAYRAGRGQKTVSALDSAERYGLAEYSRGDNASPLIFTCAYADFLSIDRDAYDIVAVTGNSMGWYIALACAGAVAPMDALHILNTTGTMMQEQAIGGQVICGFVDDDWLPVPGRREMLIGLTREIDDLYVSIELGGMLVFGGSIEALDALEARVPREGRFPLRLPGHAAFHTPLQRDIAQKARAALAADLFHTPQIPLIDGRGAVWTPYSADPRDMWDYTLGHQICACYDFTTAVRVGVREYAPDMVIVLGPGTTLGGATAQSLIAAHWQGWRSRGDFQKMQESAPRLITMGMQAQRALLCPPAGET